jgi:hypothetical protein
MKYQTRVIPQIIFITRCDTPHRQIIQRDLLD